MLLSSRLATLGTVYPLDYDCGSGHSLEAVFQRIYLDFSPISRSINVVDIATSKQ